MISVFLREQKRYSQEELVKAFECSEEKTVHILKRLKEYGVLKAVKASEDQKNLTDLLDEDIEDVEDETPDTFWGKVKYTVANLSTYWWIVIGVGAVAIIGGAIIAMFVL